METSIFLGGVIFENTTSESNITYKIRLAAKLRNSGAAYGLIDFDYLIIGLYF